MPIRQEYHQQRIKCQTCPFKKTCEVLQSNRRNIEKRIPGCSWHPDKEDTPHSREYNIIYDKFIKACEKRERKEQEWEAYYKEEQERQEKEKQAREAKAENERKYLEEQQRYMKEVQYCLAKNKALLKWINKEKATTYLEVKFYREFFEDSFKHQMEWYKGDKHCSLYKDFSVKQDWLNRTPVYVLLDFLKERKDRLGCFVN